MILWSVQHRAAYEELLKTGTLRANEDFIWKDVFQKSYHWMCRQMKERIGESPKGVRYPVWAWYQYEGKRKRPSMRKLRKRYGNPGTPLVVLTIDVPDDNVLLSDFGYWHHVLNDVHMVFPFDVDVHYPQDVKEKSWENIFDITCSFDDGETTVISTQATMWEIKKEWVQKVKYFVGR